MEHGATVKRLLIRFLVCAAVAAGVLAVWALWWEPGRLVFHERTVELPCWRGAPVRIAVMSDPIFTSVLRTSASRS